MGGTVCTVYNYSQLIPYLYLSMCGLSIFMFASPVSPLLQAGTWTKTFCRNISSLQ